MMNPIYQNYFIGLFILGFLITHSVCGQNYYEKPQITFIKNYFSHPMSLSKDKIGKSLDNIDSLKSFSISKPDSNSSKGKVKVEKIVALATIGFFSGLFMGATTEQFGYFQGPVFRLKPALIGAGIGVVISFIVPGKSKSKGKSKQN